MLFTTSICGNYLPRAIALGESINKHYPGANFFPCLLERSIPDGAENLSVFSRILLAKDIVPYNLEHFIFRHTIVEASTAVKGDLMHYLFEAYPEENVFIYLDPDIYLYSDFPELEALLDEFPIVLTPHLVNRSDFVPMEVSSLEHGLYNLGFLGLRRSIETSNLLEWWKNRLHRMCYDAKYTGIFTDQKWFDLVPLFFKTKLLMHSGYNVGPWALHSRTATTDENGSIMISGQALRFIHFSGFPDIFYHCVHNWLSKGRDIFVKLADVYAAKLQENVRFASLPWSYGRYLNGRRISEFARMTWRRLPADGDISPFSLSNRQILGKKWFLTSFDTFYLTWYKKFYEKMRSSFHIWD
jgi:hypothetical protein